MEWRHRLCPEWYMRHLILRFRSAAFGYLHYLSRCCTAYLYRASRKRYLALQDDGGVGSVAELPDLKLLWTQLLYSGRIPGRLVLRLERSQLQWRLERRQRLQSERR